LRFYGVAETGDPLTEGGSVMAAHNATAYAADAAGRAADAARGMVGKTVAEVEQDLILDTLVHCLGNRTHAANILGISIRTLRNKLKQYSEEGANVPPPPMGVAA
jgi:DNA-binding NtrC family response regulator